MSRSSVVVASPLVSVNLHLAPRSRIPIEIERCPIHGPGCGDRERGHIVPDFHGLEGEEPSTSAQVWWMPSLPVSAAIKHKSTRQYPRYACFMSASEYPPLSRTWYDEPQRRSQASILPVGSPLSSNNLSGSRTRKWKVYRYHNGTGIPLLLHDCRQFIQFHEYVSNHANAICHDDETAIFPDNHGF